MKNLKENTVSHFCQPIDPIEEEKQGKLTWKMKLLLFIVAPIAILMVSKVIKERASREKSLRNKIKYMKPSIKEGFFGNTVTWEMRDKPLTKEELKSFNV